MDAVHDGKVQKTELIRSQVAAMLGSWERATGLEICFRQMSGAWQFSDGRGVVVGPLSLHRSSFCMARKDRQLPLCMKDDNIDLPGLFSPPDASEQAAFSRHGAGVFEPVALSASGAPVVLPEGQELQEEMSQGKSAGRGDTSAGRGGGGSGESARRRLKVLSSVGRVVLPGGMIVRTCHAGATELLLPIWRENVLAVVVFMGQFRLAGSRPREADGRALPVFDEQKVGHVVRMAMMLRAYVHDLFHWLESVRPDSKQGRSLTVTSFVRRHLSQGPTLAMLAEHLSLSPWRTSHMVREVTGRSFQQVVESQRLEVACDLLRDTQAKIDWVATQTGFRDTAYFCRYFKQRMKVTPGQYRRQQKRSVRV